MIKINTDELDRLTDMFIRLGSDIEDSMGRVTMIRGQMLSDTVFMSHPKCEGIITVLDNAVNELAVVNENVRSIEVLFNQTKADFTFNENELVKKINEINNRMDSIRSQLDSTINSNQVVVIDRSEDMHPVNEVERLVAGSSTVLELVNISALSKMASDSSEVRSVEDR